MTARRIPSPCAALLAQELNKIVRQNPAKKISDGKRKNQLVEVLSTPELFAGIHLSKETEAMLARRLAEKQEDDARAKAKAKGEKLTEKPGKAARVNLAILNRKLLQDAYPDSLPFDETYYSIPNDAASLLTTFGFFLFFIGRFTGARLLKKYAAHKVLGIYGVLSVIACALVVAKLGWFSAVCVFLSYFFMSIMFPTIFALGIFGLGTGRRRRPRSSSWRSWAGPSCPS